MSIDRVLMTCTVTTFILSFVTINLGIRKEKDVVKHKRDNILIYEMICEQIRLFIITFWIMTIVMIILTAIINPLEFFNSKIVDFLIYITK